MGCWKDTSKIKLLDSLEKTDVILDGPYNNRSDPLEKCYKVVSKLGYPLFGLRNGGLCAGSKNAHKNYMKQGKGMSCVGGKGTHKENDIYFINSKSKF